jgi:hypothetical protein
MLGMRLHNLRIRKGGTTMKLRHSRPFTRALCCLLALGVFFALLAPQVALAAQVGADPAQAADEASLTGSDALDMREADRAVAALTESDAFASMSLDERYDAAEQQLLGLADEGLIDRRSLYYDEDMQMFTFSYRCGVLGGVLLQDFEDLTPAQADYDLPVLPAASAADEECDVENSLDASEDTADTASSVDSRSGSNALIGTADIYYAFDDPMLSSRFPYYAVMQQSWSGAGLTTRIHTNLTVASMRNITPGDVCVFSMHGAYYTYTYGLLWKRTITAPMMILTEESSLLKDLIYASDLLTHRVIKVNGLYCLLPSFFLEYLNEGQFSGTIVFSETCDFFGKGVEDYTLASPFLSAGASAVVGFYNTVYATYSRNVMWDTINQLIYGLPVQEALAHATERYGSDDVEWYSSLTTRVPHALASYPLYVGNGEALLPYASRGLYYAAAA